jgi:hypothetical protein
MFIFSNLYILFAIVTLTYHAFTYTDKYVKNEIAKLCIVLRDTYKIIPFDMKMSCFSQSLHYHDLSYKA